MTAILSYPLHLVFWSIALAIPLTLLEGTPRSFGIASIWVGLAVPLAAYPAGIALGRTWLSDGGRLLSSPRAAMALVAAFGCGSVLAYLSVNVIGPVLLSDAAHQGHRIWELAGLSLGELRALLVEARSAIPATSADPDSWYRFNELAYAYVRRTDGLALPFLFGAVGWMTGLWTTKVPPALTRILELEMGAVLLVTTYLAGENGWEMIVARAGYDASFAADLVLIVPLALVVGLGLPTLVGFGSARPDEAR